MKDFMKNEYINMSDKIRPHKLFVQKLIKFAASLFESLEYAPTR